MTTDNHARQLHDRTTRGEALTPAEQAVLDAWYRAQDQAEGILLAPAAALPVDALRHQIATTVDRLEHATQQIQELTAQNDALRQEIVALQQQLAPFPSEPAPAR